MDTQVEHVNFQEFHSINDIIRQRIAIDVDERPFFVVNMHDIYQKHTQWLKLMPRVKPFYAVKCNNLPEVVSFLALIGTGFDCASKQEIDQVLALGVNPSNIIYANPCKTRTFIEHSQAVGVDLLTFDNDIELHKIALLHPNAKLVLRIKGDDRTSRCKFNIKFGADVEKCESLLRLAKKLELNVVGISFHNGSDCQDAEAYNRTIANCRHVFDIGQTCGHSMYILDIGGGFPGHNNKPLSGGGVSFECLSKVINKALDKYFPEINPTTGFKTNYKIIAEPGRYYVASALTFVGMIIAKREERDDKTGRDFFMYYLNDGVYGSFNNIIFEHATPVPQLIDQSNFDHLQLHSTVLWGPTCDSVDCIKRDFLFPELNVGEWILFKNMGAYTCCAATNFNGFEKASVIVAI